MKGVIFGGLRWHGKELLNLGQFYEVNILSHHADGLTMLHLERPRSLLKPAFEDFSRGPELCGKSQTHITTDSHQIGTGELVPDVYSLVLP